MSLKSCWSAAAASSVLAAMLLGLARRDPPHTSNKMLVLPLNRASWNESRGPYVRRVVDATRVPLINGSACGPKPPPAHEPGCLWKRCVR